MILSSQLPNPIPLFLAALTILVGGCQAPAGDAGRGPVSVEAVGVRETHWGPLPEYKLTGPIELGSTFSRSNPNLRGVVELDVQVERSGRVQEIVVVRSSGDPRVDRAAEAAWKAAKLPELPADGPALYVVRQEMHFRRDVDGSRGTPSRNMGDQSQPVWVPMPGGPP